VKRFYVDGRPFLGYKTAVETLGGSDSGYRYALKHTGMYLGMKVSMLSPAQEQSEMAAKIEKNLSRT
jgi:hypothetical protein